MDDKRFEGIPKNYKTFILDYSNDPHEMCVLDENNRDNVVEVIFGD